ncbi:MAG: hypothetical protein EXR98_00665 [Gemmataceae bacterium]|nr:hypothetical protein [Gemmataceae bacterium]
MNDRLKPARPARTGLWLAVIAVALVAAGVGVWYRFLRTPPPEIRQPLAPALPSPDPRLSYEGPFKNVDPKVAYVDDAECAKCHRDQAKTYSQHPMARTLMPIDKAVLTAPPGKGQKPFEALGQQFQIDDRDGRVRHARFARDDKEQALFRHELDVHFVVGSGTRAHSFLSVQGTTVLQTPITWFTQKKLWDLSPGFQHNVLAGRRIGADCFFCHSNGANEDPKDETTYHQPIFPHGHSIGCQRCHGPGGEHVKNPGVFVKTAMGSLDPTIVNPAHLSPQLRESVCWQCHLEGHVRVLRRGRHRYDFRPGMPLEDFIGVFDDTADADYDHVVNHVEQMLQSRCYQKSAGPQQMGCVSCHDAHEAQPPEKQAAFYRARCVTCHEDKACSLPLPQRLAKHKDDSCIACHMPAFGASDVTHVSSTDHRVPRKPKAKTDTPAMKKGPIEDLVSVFERHRGRTEPELTRDWALAGGLSARRGRPLNRSLFKEFGDASQRDPGDLAIKTQYALELINRREAGAAVKLLEDVLAREPDYEDGLFAFALACEQLNRGKDSLSAWRRLVAMAPTQWGYRVGLGEQLMDEKNFVEAEKAARAWVAYDPGVPEARKLLGDSLAVLGRAAEAQEQYRILRELTRGKSK